MATKVAYSKEQILDILLHAEEHDAQVTCDQFGVSLGTLKRWQNGIDAPRVLSKYDAYALVQEGSLAEASGKLAQFCRERNMPVSTYYVYSKRMPIGAPAGPAIATAQAAPPTFNTPRLGTLNAGPPTTLSAKRHEPPPKPPVPSAKERTADSAPPPQTLVTAKLVNTIARELLGGAKPADLPAKHSVGASLVEAIEDGKHALLETDLRHALLMERAILEDLTKPVEKPTPAPKPKITAQEAAPMPAQKKPRLTPEKTKEMLRLAREGMSIPNIARKFGVSTATVYSARTRYKEPTTRKVPGAAAIEAFVQAYCAGVRAEEAARRNGLSKSTGYRLASGGHQDLTRDQRERLARFRKGEPAPAPVQLFGPRSVSRAPDVQPAGVDPGPLGPPAPQPA